MINDVQHQGCTSTAMYAVAPHLIAVAREAAPERALWLLTDAGLIYASSGKPNAAPCPDFLMEEFISSAAEGARILVLVLPLAVGFDAFKSGVAALAGFLRHDSFGRFLDGLELYEGRFHHVLLDGPFPPEV